jgi:hypothetical protein
MTFAHLLQMWKTTDEKTNHRFSNNPLQKRDERDGPDTATPTLPAIPE